MKSRRNKLPFTFSGQAMRRVLRATGLLIVGAFSVTAQGGYILEIDLDGLDDGPVTYNSHFSFGGDTTTASQSVTSNAYGTTGADSIFGGDGVNFPDTYVYTYSPSVDADNLVIPAGTDLGGGNLASGLVGGGLGTYRVYATWPSTTNVSGGDTLYTIATSGGNTSVLIDQNGKGDEWIPVGDIAFSDSLSSIVVTQQPTVSNSFVSMRSYGLLFERVGPPVTIPAPAVLPLLGIGLTGLAWARRRIRA